MIPGGLEAAWSTLVGLSKYRGGSCTKLWPSLYISALVIVGEMVQIMCQRFIQERYDSALGPDRSWKYEDAVSFDISTDGIVELDIVTPLADIIDDGEDG